MAPATIAVVTGANKGIGKAIVRNLALQYPQSPANKGSFLIYLTARDQKRGQDALQSLLADDAQLKSAKALAKDGGLTDIKYHSLDISQTKSIQDFRDYLKVEHPEGIDILINNAGIAMDGYNEHVVKTTLEVNYYGTLEMCQDFLPLLKPHGARLINVASMTGHLKRLSPSLREEFLATTKVSEITALVERFRAAAARGTESSEGFLSNAAYATSKAAEIGMTRALAREESAKGNAVLINSCCPGYIKSDMTKNRGVGTPDQGSQTPVLLALGDINGQSGLFWQNMKPSEW